MLACGNFQMPYTYYTSRPWRESGISEQLFSILSVAHVVFHHLIYLWPQQFRSSWITANALTIMRPSRFGDSSSEYDKRRGILFNTACHFIEFNQKKEIAEPMRMYVNTFYVCRLFLMPRVLRLS